MAVLYTPVGRRLYARAYLTILAKHSASKSPQSQSWGPFIMNACFHVHKGSPGLYLEFLIQPMLHHHLALVVDLEPSPHNDRRVAMPVFVDVHPIFAESNVV